MRIEIVKRELNQGALAGTGLQITDYAARLIIAALDTYDQHALAAEYHRGIQEGFRLARKLGRHYQRVVDAV